MQHAKESIEQRIDDCMYAVKKHGLRTLTAAFRRVLDWKVRASAGAAAIYGGWLGGPWRSELVRNAG